ncbi:putative protein-tyrosine phosphatase [Mycobacterium avium subsp. paratuberculosis S5]|nr:putative protein-tyrosine phosphatase [Mycobacterium avium subsp. paratuberculosis S5]
MRLAGQLRLGRQRRRLHPAGDLAQRRRQGQRVAGQHRARLVGLVFARPGHRQPHHGGRDRAQQRNQQQRKGILAVAVVAAEHAGEHGHVGQRGDHRRHRAGDARDQDVAVVDVGQLVSQHGAQLTLVEDAQDAGGAADRGVARVAAGGKRVGRVGVADVEPGHRLVRGGGQLAHDPVHRRRLQLGDRLRVHGAQRQLVAVVVGVDVHADGEQHREEHRGPAEQRPHEHDQRGHADQQGERLEPVGMRMPGHRCPPRSARAHTRSC